METSHKFVHQPWNMWLLFLEISRNRKRFSSTSQIQRKRPSRGDDDDCEEGWRTSFQRVNQNNIPLRATKACGEKRNRYYLPQLHKFDCEFDSRIVQILSDGQARIAVNWINNFDNWKEVRISNHWTRSNVLNWCLPILSIRGLHLVFRNQIKLTSMNYVVWFLENNSWSANTSAILGWRSLAKLSPLKKQLEIRGSIFQKSQCRSKLV